MSRFLSTSPAIYLASPLGFVPYGRDFARALVSRVQARGLVALDPWASPEGAELGALVVDGASFIEIADANRRVGEANLNMIEGCDAVFACLDGTSVDDGTASEIGYAAGIGRVVVGFRTDVRITGDNAATPVNLQVAYFIERSGGAIFTGVDEALDHLETLLRE
jgi:nucleoside 2-deoxyribosyltransferase